MSGEPQFVIRAVRDAALDGTMLRIQMETQSATKWYQFPVNPNDKFVSRYISWVKARQLLLRNYLSLPLEVQYHPSIRAQHKYGHVNGVTVNPDYLEKSDIAWWSMSQLQSDLASSDHFSPFRPCFRSVIRVVLQHFTDNKLLLR